MTAPVTGITPIYGLEYPVEGEPIRYTRQKLERTMLAIEEALSNGGVAATGASDLLAVSGRVSTLEALSTASAYAALRGTGGLSLTSGTWTALPMTGTEDADALGGHSTTVNTSRWTCPPGQGGLYLAGGVVGFAGAAGGRRYAGVRKNGVDNTVSNASIGAASITTGVQVTTSSWPFMLDPGDYLELWGLQDSGSALNANLSSSGFWLSRIQKS